MAPRAGTRTRPTVRSPRDSDAHGAEGRFGRRVVHRRDVRSRRLFGGDRDDDRRPAVSSFSLDLDAADDRRAALELQRAEGDRLAYLNPRRIGHVHATDSVAAFIADEELGPDALDPAFDEKAFAAVLAKHKQAIKAVLMDQARIAGIGNIYADEILFQARLHPGIPANRLDADAQRRLFGAVKYVLQTAIDYGAGAEDFTDRLPKGFLLPERHAGGHCPRCGTLLVIEKRGGRTSYHCPKCQPEPGDC